MSTVTLPKVEFREARPYVAVRQRVTIPFGDGVDAALAPVEDYIKAQGFAEYGPCLFRYTLIDMPRLEVEFGFFTPRLLPPRDGLVVGEVPAGTYAFVLHTGPYDDLMEVNGLLIGWAAHKGIDWDVEKTSEGDRFASRLEIYLNPPVGDPNTWQTEVAIRIRG